jgi:hypothetical protein
VVIEETSTWLKQWVDDTVGDQVAVLGRRRPANGGPGTRRRRTARRSRGASAALVASPRGGRRYLITTWAAEPLDAHALSQLLFSALQNAALEVDVEPPPLGVWRGLGCRHSRRSWCRAWKDLTPRRVTAVETSSTPMSVSRVRCPQRSAATPHAVGGSLTVHLDGKE